jgi:hypothetical protein
VRSWRTWILVGAASVTVGLLLFTTGAGAATRKAVPKLWGGGGSCGALMSNPDAVKGMQDLRVEHRADMQAWWQKYGSDPQSAAAQEALRALRQEHWNDMRALFKKFGIAAPATAQGQAGPGMMGGGPGGRGGTGAGGCWNGTQTPAETSSGASGYGSGMMGGGYGGMMGQSL